MYILWSQAVSPTFQVGLDHNSIVGIKVLKLFLVFNPSNAKIANVPDYCCYWE